MQAENREALQKAELLLALRQRGILSRQVMGAFERVPREIFVDPAFRDLAWSDQPLPIECGQTISQPTLVAKITQALDLEAGHSALEIGTGSGYQAAILGHIVDSVVTIERFRTLADQAALRLREIGLGNVEVIVADGHDGAPARAPFDRIVVSAAVDEVPAHLLDQLGPEGVLIAPVGPADAPQMLTRFTRTEVGVTQRDLGWVRFVPLLRGTAVSL